MQKKTILSLLLLSSLSGVALAQTAQQKATISQVIRVYNSGFDAMDAGDFVKAAAVFTQCGQMVDANSGMRNLKTDDSGETFGEMGALCYSLVRAGSLELLAQNASASQKVRDYMTQLKTLKGEECYQIASYLGAQYPALKYAMINGKTVGAITARCQGEVLAGQPVTNAERQEAQQFAPLVPQLAKLRSDFKAAQGRPEKTDRDVLLKYQGLLSASNRAQEMAAMVAATDASTRRASLGSTTLGALVDDISRVSLETGKAFNTFKPKAKGAFDRQEAAAKTELSRILKGDKLSIYRRQGLPSSNSGNPTFASNGIYSADGKALAKEIAASTLWFYNDKGNGCTYKYWFNGHTVSKVEKPYGC
ncbi:hypothetical protein D3875_14515 [Deinococcus cavernae]|uniref:Sel1 repeat family protein n=1 Tax=Deinococcus cavernae TaxID=2320857 RepID=A0A418V8Y0_9DEIO|nr:hypothetical protein [Deinococcus cavernae]RJF72575.1 hypothetical protein D3875_14515 [Deinococcus cavernae]